MQQQMESFSLRVLNECNVFVSVYDSVRLQRVISRLDSPKLESLSTNVEFPQNQHFALKRCQRQSYKNGRVKLVFQCATKYLSFSLSVKIRQTFPINFRKFAFIIYYIYSFYDYLSLLWKYLRIIFLQNIHSYPILHTYTRTHARTYRYTGCQVKTITMFKDIFIKSFLNKNLNQNVETVIVLDLEIFKVSKSY